MRRKKRGFAALPPRVPAFLQQGVRRPPELYMDADRSRTHLQTPGSAPASALSAAPRCRCSAPPHATQPRQASRASHQSRQISRGASPRLLLHRPARRLPPAPFFNAAAPDLALLPLPGQAPTCPECYPELPASAGWRWMAT